VHFAEVRPPPVEVDAGRPIEIPCGVYPALPVREFHPQPFFKLLIHQQMRLLQLSPKGILLRQNLEGSPAGIRIINFQDRSLGNWLKGKIIGPGIGRSLTALNE
jgi:hypothetical protein